MPSHFPVHEVFAYTPGYCLFVSVVAVVVSCCSADGIEVVPSVVVYDCMVFDVFAFGCIVALGWVGGCQWGTYCCNEHECDCYVPDFYFGCFHSLCWQNVFILYKNRDLFLSFLGTAFVFVFSCVYRYLKNIGCVSA